MGKTILPVFEHNLLKRQVGQHHGLYSRNSKRSIHKSNFSFKNTGPGVEILLETYSNNDKKTLQALTASILRFFSFLVPWPDLFVKERAQENA